MRSGRWSRGARVPSRKLRAVDASAPRRTLSTRVRSLLGSLGKLGASRAPLCEQMLARLGDLYTQNILAVTCTLRPDHSQEKRALANIIF